MPTPAKPFAVLVGEGKSHRTKAELELRKQGEAALATGQKLKERKEVRDNPIAHKEFLRLKKLLEAIEKNDAIYENIINRYCLLLAECVEFEERRELFARNLEKLEDERGDMEPSQFYKIQSQMQKNIISVDRQIQTKRKMLFDIERENIMTIASALRSIPKKVDKAENPLLRVLDNDNK